MKEYDKFYKELRKSLSDKEIAESYMIPDELTAEEEKFANEEFRKFRFKRLKEMTEEQRIYGDLTRLRFLIKEYIEKSEFEKEIHFGTFLEEFIRILRKTKKQVASDLNLHYTKMSRIINDKDNPNIDLTYRLEKYSGGIIPAILWWKLSIKKQEYLIQVDKKRRKTEAAKVKNAIKFRA